MVGHNSPMVGQSRPKMAQDSAEVAPRGPQEDCDKASQRLQTRLLFHYDRIWAAMVGHNGPMVGQSRPKVAQDGAEMAQVQQARKRRGTDAGRIPRERARSTEGHGLCARRADTNEI